MNSGVGALSAPTGLRKKRQSPFRRVAVSEDACREYTRISLCRIFVSDQKFRRRVRSLTRLSPLDSRLSVRGVPEDAESGDRRPCGGIQGLQAAGRRASNGRWVPSRRERHGRDRERKRVPGSASCAERGDPRPAVAVWSNGVHPQPPRQPGRVRVRTKRALPDGGPFCAIGRLPWRCAKLRRRPGRSMPELCTSPPSCRRGI